jgi:hypothetical protein
MSTIDPGNDDEALSALLDGALDDDAARKLRRRLEQEPALAARFEALHSADTRVKAAYAGMADEPLPQAVLERLEARPVERAERAKVAVRSLSRAAKPRPSWHVPTTVAAGIALAIGVSFGWLIGAREPERVDALLAGAGSIERNAALYALFERTPSGEAYELGALSATPRLSYRDTAGRFCRQAVLSTRSGDTQTLACRSDAGIWRIELIEFAPEGSTLYRPASGNSMIETAVDDSISGAPLEPDEERALIENGWSFRD